MAKEKRKRKKEIIENNGKMTKEKRENEKWNQRIMNENGMTL